MGFCVFNNVAVGGHAGARACTGCRGSRSSISTSITATAPRRSSGTTRDTLYVSTHQSPLYPGTGLADERGIKGNILNRAAAARAPAAQAGGGWSSATCCRRSTAGGRELIFVSAGFDAHADDPLASMALVEEDFAWVTRELWRLAERHARGADCLGAGGRL